MLPRRSDAPHPVDREQAVVVGPVAVGVDVPLPRGGEHRPGIDAPGGELVAAERVVVDLDPLGGLGGGPERLQVARRPERDGNRVAGAEDPGQLPEGRRQRPLRVGARHGQERLPGSQEGETLARRQAERAGEVLGEAEEDPAVDHLAVDQPVGGVGRQAAERDQFEVPLQVGDLHPEAGGELVEAAPLVVDDPGDDREEPPQPHGGVGPGHAPASGPAPARADSHRTMSARSSAGASTSAWSRRPSTNDRKASRLVTAIRNTTDPSSCRSATACPPRSASTQPAWRADTSTSASTGSSSPKRHGSSRRAEAGSNPSGRSKAPPGPASIPDSMRSARKARIASRSASNPTTYQWPLRNRIPYGSRRRGPPR